MTSETRAAIVEHAVRWARNILVEVLSHHGTHVAPEARQKLRDAVSLLAEFDHELGPRPRSAVLDATDACRWCGRPRSEHRNSAHEQHCVCPDGKSTYTPRGLDTRERTSPTPCRYCGKTLAEHGPDTGPNARMMCLGKKSGFVPEAQ